LKKHPIPFQEERDPDYDTCTSGVLGSVKMSFLGEKLATRVNVTDERPSGLRRYSEERFLRCVGRQLHGVKLSKKAVGPLRSE